MKIRLEKDNSSRNILSVAPKNYSDFYKIWFPKLRTHIYYKGYFPDDIIEDVTQELMTDFFEGDYLNKFDPDKMFLNKKTGEMSKVKFSTFLYSWTNKKLLGKRDAYKRLFWAEGLSTNKLISDSDNTTTFLDSLGAVADNYQLEFKELVDYIKESLKERKVTSLGNNFPLFFDKIMEHVFSGGKTQREFKTKSGLNLSSLAKDLGISTTGVSYMLNKLRVVLKDDLGITY